MKYFESANSFDLPLQSKNYNFKVLDTDYKSAETFNDFEVVLSDYFVEGDFFAMNDNSTVRTDWSYNLLGVDMNSVDTQDVVNRLTEYFKLTAKLIDRDPKLLVDLINEKREEREELNVIFGEGTYTYGGFEFEGGITFDFDNKDKQPKIDDKKELPGWLTFEGEISDSVYNSFYHFYEGERVTNSAITWIDGENEIMEMAEIIDWYLDGVNEVMLGSRDLQGSVEFEVKDQIFWTMK